MATKLEKDITRESTVKVEDKEIMVTLTGKQEITMKLKGKRTGAVSIPIETLYNQLTGTEPVDSKGESKSIAIVKTKKVSKSNPMMSLYDLRSHNAISTLDLPTIAKFDQIIKSLIDEIKYENKRKG